MFNHNFFKHKTIVQFATTAGVAILISLYAVAQGFTLPLHFESHPKSDVLNTQTSSTNSRPTVIPAPNNNSIEQDRVSNPATVTPTIYTSHTSPITQTSQTSLTVPSPNVPLAEVADLPLRAAEISNESTEKVLEQTHQIIIPIVSVANQTVNNLTGVLTKDK